MDSKTADKQQIPTIRKNKLMYLHNLEIIANPQIEHEIEHCIAHMYVNNLESTKGQVLEVKDQNVITRERKLSVRCHNGWKNIGDEVSTTLSAQNKYGQFLSNVSIQLKDFIPDEMIAIIFELQFKCEI